MGSNNNLSRSAGSVGKMMGPPAPNSMMGQPIGQMGQGIGPSSNSSIMQDMNQMPKALPNTLPAPNLGGQTTQPVSNPPDMLSQGPQIPPNASPQDIQTMMNNLNTYSQANTGGNPQMDNISNMVSALQGPSPLQQSNPQMGQIGANLPMSPMSPIPSGNQSMGGMMRSTMPMPMSSGSMGGGSMGAANNPTQFRRPMMGQMMRGIGPSITPRPTIQPPTMSQGSQTGMMQ